MTCGTVTLLTQHANPIWSRSNSSSAKVDHDNQSTVLVTSHGMNAVEMLIQREEVPLTETGYVGLWTQLP